jgi:hypothetical protein
MKLTDKQAEALQIIKEWANDEYQSSNDQKSAFVTGVNAAKWEIQTILNLAGL